MGVKRVLGGVWGVFATYKTDPNTNPVKRVPLHGSQSGLGCVQPICDVLCGFEHSKECTSSNTERNCVSKQTHTTLILYRHCEVSATALELIGGVMMLVLQSAPSTYDCGKPLPMH